MKKVFVLLCGILLLCAACAPVTPETPEQSADATAAATTTTATTTSFAATTTAPTTATTRGQIIVDPIMCWERIAYYEYVDWVRGMANDIEGLSQTLYRSKYSTFRYYVDYYHELWLTDRCVWLPVLPDGWYCELVRVVSGGRVFFSVFNEAGEEFTITFNTYRGDARDKGPHNNSTPTLRYWSTLNQEEAALENGYPVKALKLKDGTPCKFTEYNQYGAFGEADGYMWRVREGGDTDTSGTIGVEDLVRNLSFEKIEL